MPFNKIDTREDIKLPARIRCFLPRWAQRFCALQQEQLAASQEQVKRLEQELAEVRTVAWREIRKLEEREKQLQEQVSQGIDRVCKWIADRDNSHSGVYPKWDSLSQEGRDWYRAKVSNALLQAKVGKND